MLSRLNLLPYTLHFRFCRLQFFFELLSLLTCFITLSSLLRQRFHPFLHFLELSPQSLSLPLPYHLLFLFPKFRHSPNQLISLVLRPLSDLSALRLPESRLLHSQQQSLFLLFRFFLSFLLETFQSCNLSLVTCAASQNLHAAIFAQTRQYTRKM